MIVCEPSCTHWIYDVVEEMDFAKPQKAPPGRHPGSRKDPLTGKMIDVPGY